MLNERLKKNLWFAYLCVLICWAIQAYALIGQYLQERSLFAHMENGHPYISDFLGFYTMACLAKRSEQEHINLYDPNVQNETAKLLTAPIAPESPFSFEYPPWFYPLLRPLAIWPISQAFLLWDALGVLATGLAVCWLAFGFHKNPFARVFVLVAVFASFQTWLGFRLGQTAWLNFCALVAFWCLIGTRRPFFAGLVASIFTIKFQYLPLPFLVGLMLGKFRFFIGFALMTTLLLAVTVLMVGWSNIASYPQALLNHEVGNYVVGIAPEVMQNLRGTLVLFTNADDHLVRMAAVIFFLVGVVLGAALFIRQKTNQIAIDRDFQIKASICSLVMLIASPHTHVQDYLVAAIPALWLWQAISGHSAPLLRTLILAFPALSWLFYYLRPLFMFARIQPFFLWAVLVIFLAMSELRRPPEPGQENAAAIPDETSTDIG
jgi:Glycosyltransferase family 87